MSEDFYEYEEIIDDEKTDNYQEEEMMLDNQLDGLGEGKIDDEDLENVLCKSTDENWELYKDYYNDEMDITNEEIFRKINRDDVSEYEKGLLLDKLSKDNEKLVYYVTNKFQSFRQMIQLDDLADAGMLGYAKAIASYDPDRGVKFSTFAINCIKNEISFAIRKERRHYDKDISINYIAHENKNGRGLIIEDSIACDGPTPQDDINNTVLQKAIRECLNRLSAMEKYVVVYRFGLDRGITLTQKDIAELVDMSQANISKIERNCTEKLGDILLHRI